MNIYSDDYVVVFTGQLIKRKRPLDILKAYKYLKEKDYNLKLFLLGDGLEKETLKEYIHLNNMEEDVFMLGKLSAEEMSKYLSIANLYVLPSERDASPKALNEAMNFELPIIVTDGIDTAKEMCIDGYNGYIIPVGDYKTLAEKIIKIIIGNTNNKMGIKSREIVSKYSYKRVCESWINAINYCLKER